MFTQSAFSDLFCLVFLTCVNQWPVVDLQLENKTEQSLSLAGRVNDALFFCILTIIGRVGKLLTCGKNLT